MKRMFQVSFDTLLISALPILLWIVLGVILRPEIANVFALTYPLQFIYVILVCVFAIGANITARRKKRPGVVFSNMTCGIVVAGILTILLCLNADGYIELMNMEPETYRSFCIYNMMLMFFGFIMQVISQKLYYENKNRDSNIANLVFNVTNFGLIIVLAMLMTEELAITLTLIIDAIILVVMLPRFFRATKFELMLKNNIKNSSFGILDNLGMVLFYGVRYWNSFAYGQKYIDAINFETLTTDTQWDMIDDAVHTTAKVDLTAKKFNYKKSLKQAYKFVLVMMGTVLILNLALYWYFRPELWILVILLSVQAVDMLLRPLIMYRWNYLQIEDNKAEHNVVFLMIRFVTILASLLPTAFCTYIGQLVTAVLEYVYARAKCKKVELFKL